jgi:hypothetical protein
MGERQEFRFLESLSILFMRTLAPLLPSKIKKSLTTDVSHIAYRMVEESLSNDSSLKIIESADI